MSAGKVAIGLVTALAAAGAWLLGQRAGRQVRATAEQSAPPRPPTAPLEGDDRIEDAVEVPPRR